MAGMFSSGFSSGRQYSPRQAIAQSWIPKYRNAAANKGHVMAETGRGSRTRVAILISGRGSNMAALIAAAKAPSFSAEIALVLSNRPEAGGLAYARAAGIATAVVDHAAYGKDREAFERAMQAVLEQHRIDLVCLAGFMRLLTPWLVGAWAS